MSGTTWREFAVLAKERSEWGDSWPPLRVERNSTSEEVVTAPYDSGFAYPYYGTVGDVNGRVVSPDSEVIPR